MWTRSWLGVSLIPHLLGCSGDPRPLKIDDGPIDNLVLARQFDVFRNQPSPVSVTCTSPDEPDEQHVITVDEERTVHHLELYGLLPDTRYDCTFVSGVREGTIAFRTDPMPDGFPTWSTTVTDRAGSGYTLFNHGLDTNQPDREAKLLVVDREGRPRWYWECPVDASDLDSQYLGDGRILLGGGYAAAPTILDLAGTVLHQAGPSTNLLPYHHHAERIDTGEIATLTLERVEDGDARWSGFVVELYDATLSERRWSFGSHELYAAGDLPFVPNVPDPWHANSIQFADDALYVNLYGTGTTLKLDRSSGEHQWTLGPNGDFAMTTGDDSDWFFRAHAPEFDGDRVLLYDNGVGRPAAPAPFSRVMELELDEAAMTATPVWSWTMDDWFEPIWGDVDRLDDGHVLITRAHCDHCGPSELLGGIVEVDPADDTIVWELRMSSPLDGGYRSARIDGCAIFANQAYCP